MLFFEGNKIIFNKEVGISGKYKVTDFSYGPKDKLKDFLPNCSLFQKVKASEIKDSGQIFGLGSYWQFPTFITSWMVNCMKNNNFYLPEDIAWGWIVSYYKTILKYSGNFNDYTRDTLFFPEITFLVISKEQWQKINLNKSPIEIDYPVKPEISWAIVDCWIKLIEGKKELPFEEQVNAYIQDNIIRLKDKVAKMNSYGTPLLNLEIPLESNINVRNIDYSNKQSFFYFYCPVCEELVRTNTLYLQQQWKKLRKCLFIS